MMAKKSRSIKQTHLLQQTIHPNAAGIDIGAEELVCAIPLDKGDEHPVRSFGTYAPDLRELVDWLKKHKIETVAMESTGVYWKRKTSQIASTVLCSGRKSL